MRVASQFECLIMALRMMLRIAYQGCLSSLFILIYNLYIVVGEDLVWDVTCWNYR